MTGGVPEGLALGINREKMGKSGKEWGFTAIALIKKIWLWQQFLLIKNLSSELTGNSIKVTRGENLFLKILGVSEGGISDFLSALHSIFRSGNRVVTRCSCCSLAPR